MYTNFTFFVLRYFPIFHISKFKSFLEQALEFLKFLTTSTLVSYQPVSYKKRVTDPLLHISLA